MHGCAKVKVPRDLLSAENYRGLCLCLAGNRHGLSGAYQRICPGQSSRRERYRRSGFPVYSVVMDDSQLVNYPADDVLAIDDPAKLRALGHELRDRMVILLDERAASGTELAKALGVPKGTAGYHLKVLERAGLVRVVATRRVRAVTEKFYGLTARLFQFNWDGGLGEAHATGAHAASTLRRGADLVPLDEVDPGLIKAGIVRVRMRRAVARDFIQHLHRLLLDFNSQEDPDGETFVFTASIFPASSRLPERDDSV